MFNRFMIKKKIGSGGLSEVYLAYDFDLKKEVALKCGKEITIGREYGSGGKYIGERLAEELNVKLYDKEILQKVAEESGMDLNLIEEMDEKQEQSFWYTFAMSLYATDSLDTLSEIPSNQKLFLEQAKIIEELAQKEDCIIIGRCSNVILRNKPEVFNVFVYSSELDFKVQRKMKYGNFESELDVIKTIERVDKERENYYNYFTKENWGNRKYYDLMIDTSKIGVDGAVKLIKEYLKLKQR